MKNTLKLLLLLVLIGVSFNAQAQSWIKTIDQKFRESLIDVDTTSNGFVLMGLYFEDTSYIDEYYIMEVDTFGNMLWYKTLAFPNTHYNATRVRTLASGEFAVVGNVYLAPDSLRPFYAKFDNQGNLLLTKMFGGVGQVIIKDILILPNNDLLAVGSISNHQLPLHEIEACLFRFNDSGDSLQLQILHDADTYGAEIEDVVIGHNNSLAIIMSGYSTFNNMRLTGLDMDLNEIWSSVYTFHFPWNNAKHLMAASTGGYIVSGTEYNVDSLGNSVDFAFLAKFGDTGNVIWYKNYHLYGQVTQGYGLAEDKNGNYALMCVGSDLNPGFYHNPKPYLLIVDTSGTVIRNKRYNIGSYLDNAYISRIQAIPNGSFIIGGHVGLHNVEVEDVFLILTDSLGGVYQSAIVGKVFADDNGNCLPDSGELPIKQWLVTTDGANPYYTLTDTAGNYVLDCDTGTYTVSVVAPNANWNDTLCSVVRQAQLTAAIDTAVVHIGVGKVVDCPVLNVTVQAPFLRRCLPTPPFTVSYCNHGTVDAPGSFIDLNLDAAMVLDSAGVAYTSLGNNLYRFNLGTLAHGDCGTFNVYARIDCNSPWVMGQSYCVEASIFPDTVCLPPNPLWDGARLELETDCQPDSLLFRIINTGNDMMEYSSFIIIQDDVLYANGNFQLNNGDQFVKKVPANGATWTFMTEQTVYFPGNRQLIKSKEACGLSNQGTFSIGYLRQFPQIGPDPSKHELCLIGVASFDPNDKAPTPLGLFADGQIEDDQQLSYKIRFQNTGNDTAFFVAILDTLSPNLDLTSIRNISSSHPMQWSILQGRVLQFAFPNILLPDSNVNEPASHGFVSFDIDLMDSLPIGTQITNTAYIYFDINEAVVTNTTLNTIGNQLKTWLVVLSINSETETNVGIYPNPMQGLLNLDIEGTVSAPIILRTYDLKGRLIKEINLPAGNSHQLQLDLEAGMYLFEIQSGGERLATGKLIAY